MLDVISCSNDKVDSPARLSCNTEERMYACFDQLLLGKALLTTGYRNRKSQENADSNKCVGDTVCNVNQGFLTHG
jgi:hypothetical protein